jgi:hypothetical protein
VIKPWGWMLLIGSAGLVLGSGCAHAPKAKAAPGEARNFYPLAVGNRWTYETKMLGETAERTVEITGNRDGYYVDSGGAQLTTDAFGIRDQKRYLLRDPVEEGNAWTNVVSVSSVEHYKILAAGAPCDAPAGRFDRCVKVEGRNRIDPKTTLVNEVTFAAGVGIVRIEIFAEMGTRRIPQTSIVLKEFHVNSGKAP